MRSFQAALESVHALTICQGTVLERFTDAAWMNLKSAVLLADAPIRREFPRGLFHGAERNFHTVLKR